MAAHGAFLAALIVVGTLLSKPRMSYYAVDLFSAPAGGGATAGPVVSPVSAPVAAAPAPKAAIKLPKVAAVHAPRAAEEELPDQDTLRMLAKLKKKRLGIIKSQPSSQSEQDSTDSSENTASSPGNGRGGSGLPGSGSGVVGAAGPNFPFPWYMKAVSSKVDKEWQPPQGSQPGITCVVGFTIHREGRVSGEVIEKRSSDSFFDQLALRAVRNSNPLPPLPSGFPDETLNVHFTFTEK